MSPLCLLVLGALAVAAGEPLHERIDRAIESSHPGPFAPPADDAEFLRRAHLDLTGVIPTAEEARAFLADPTPEKRVRLIDRLLSLPEHARRLQAFFDEVLMERRGDTHIPSAEWREFLYRAFLDRKPLHLLFRELLAADGADEALRPAARFFLDRGGDLDRLTRDVGRLFLGVDLQCAQCHDHPLIDDYLQTDYQGLYAFLSRSFIFTDEAKKRSFVAEKADGDVTYESVFRRGVTRWARPHLPGASPIDEPWPERGKEYAVAPAKGIRPVPSYSRRAELARLATDGQNLLFRRNLANRLWQLLLGRGLVHPPDLAHSGNPPAHAGLLALLGDELAALGFDSRAFLRELALSRTYQRSSVLPPPRGREADLRRQIESLRAEDTGLSTAARAAEEAASRASVGLAALLRQEEAFLGYLGEARSAENEAAQSVEAAQAALKAARDDAAGREKAAGLLSEAAGKAREAGEAAPGVKKDAELEAAVARIAQRSQALAGEIEGARSAAASREADLETARTRLAGAKRISGERSALWSLSRAERRKLEEAARRSQAEAGARAAASSDAAAALKSAEMLLSSLESRSDSARKELEGRAAARFAAASLKPLSPEQLAWSLLQATGMLPALRRAAEKEAREKQKPPAGASAPEPAVLARAVDRAVYEKLRAHEGPFVSLFGGAPGEPQRDFQATAQQALFLANGDLVRGWLRPGAGGLTDRLIQLRDPAALAEELYLSVLSRRPADEEQAELAEVLASAPPEARGAALADLAWALLTTAEFRFNH